LIWLHLWFFLIRLSTSETLPENGSRKNWSPWHEWFKYPEWHFFALSMSHWYPKSLTQTHLSNWSFTWPTLTLQTLEF
jgi:hypothetical protein